MHSTSTISCDDSRLSVAANILAILTFVYAILVSTAFYLHSLHRANEDTYAIFEELAEDVVQRTIEIEAFDSEHSSTEFGHEERVLQNQMQLLLERAKKFLRILQDHASKHAVDFKPDPQLFEKEVLGRAKFVVSFARIRLIRRELDEVRIEMKILEMKISIR